MWSKLGVIIAVVTIYTSVSIFYGFYIGSQVTDLGSPTFDIGDSLAFFAKMFVFSVPGAPVYFGIIWWLLAFMLGTAVVLLIRGD